MPCTAPVEAWHSENGLSFKPPKGRPLTLARPIYIPCRNCIGCKVDRSKEWAVRCMHEASLHRDNQFITLTYDNENLPPDEGLRHSDFQKFLKRYRRRIQYREGKKITYYMCGEYGENFGRPHYHALIFGHRFNDTVSLGKPNYWRSPTLERLWPHGYSMIGNVTFNSAAYVARYIMKKQTGNKAEEHYKKVDPETGEIFDVQPEYNRMSTRPAIGKKWFEQYASDYENESRIAHVEGKAHQMPKYYLKQLKAADPDQYEIIMAERMKYAKANVPDENVLTARKHKYNHQFRKDRSLK